MASPRFTFSRLILLGSVSLTLLAVLLYLALPMLLGAWLQHLLAGQDFTQVRLELGRPGLQAVRIRELAMTRELGNQRWVFGARDIEIEYRLLDVLKGRIHSLRIPQARLDITPSPNENDRAPRVLAMPVPKNWVHALPFKELIVENVEIDWRTDSETRRAQLRGQASQADGKLHSRWSLNTPDPIDFELDIDTEGRLSAALYRRDAPTQALFRAGVVITPHANDRVAVQGTLQAKLKPLAALLAPWLPPNMQQIEGSLQATWDGEAPAQLTAGDGFKGMLGLDLTALRVGTILQAGNLLVRMNLAKSKNSWQWQLHESSRLSAQLNPVLLAVGDSAVDKGFVRGAKPMVIRAPAGLTGELTTTSTDTRFTLAPGKLRIEQVHTADVRIPKLSLTSLNPAHFRYQPPSGQWSSDGLHLKFTAPTVQPQLAAFGNIERFSLNLRLAAGALDSFPALHIEAIDLSLLGGKVSGRDIQYSRAKARNEFSLEIKGLDLARVVALEQQQQIEASGTLDGKLPFVLTHTGIRIVDGALHATPAGGVIRYHATESVQSMAAANPNLKLAMQAFSNYHYQKLDVGVNFAENGDLALVVAMAGRNPDWNAGQLINLNINLAENIPMLLRSLRSGDDIGTQFQKRADERASPKPGNRR